MTFSQLKRREFIALVGAPFAWPFSARAQQSMPVIGFLSSRSPSKSSGVVAAFRQGLGESGFAEGQNLAVAFRWAEAHYDRLPALATELVNLRVTVLFAAGGPPSAMAAKAATTTIPIIFSAVNDPVQLGLIASLNRPGGNLSGMSMFTAELAAKSVELLKEMVPTAAILTYLVNPTNPSAKIQPTKIRHCACSLSWAVTNTSQRVRQPSRRRGETHPQTGAPRRATSGESDASATLAASTGAN